MTQRAKPAGSDYQHQSWPGMYYGPEGQSKVFNGPLEVPDGWHDSPDKVGKKGAKTEIPGYAEAVAAAEAGEEQPLYHDDLDQEVPPGDRMDRLDHTGGRNNEDPKEFQDTTKDEDLDNADDAAERKPVDNEADDAVDPELEALPEYEQISKEQILSRLRNLEVDHNPNWNKDRLYDLLSDSVGTGKKAK